MFTGLFLNNLRHEEKKGPGFPLSSHRAGEQLQIICKRYQDCTGVLNLGPADIWDWVILCCRRLSCISQGVQQHPSPPHLLDSSSIFPVVTTKNVSIHCQRSPWGQNQSLQRTTAYSTIKAKILKKQSFVNTTTPLFSPSEILALCCRQI